MSAQAKKNVAVVMTGAAARGAFQAGALAQLLPALKKQGIVPRIYLGTSAGAINAALYGSFAHLPVEKSTDELLNVWVNMNESRVIRPPLLSLIGDSLRFLPGALFGIGPGITSVFDTAPLQRTAAEVLNSGQIAYNVSSGVLDAVGVVATRVPPTDAVAIGEHPHTADAHSVLFLDTTLPADQVADPRRRLQVAPGPITSEHVMASSAIPVGFPPIKVNSPDPEFDGWYIDGGVRLNAPLSPATALKADHIIVISAHSLDNPAKPFIGAGPEPDVLDATAITMESVLADRMIEDLAQLKSRNRHVQMQADFNKTLVAGADTAGEPLQLTNSRGEPLRKLRVMEVSPNPGELAQLATEALKEQPFDPQSAVLGRFLRGLGEGSGAMELLSYCYFNKRYFSDQIGVGREAARRALASGWHV